MILTVTELTALCMRQWPSEEKPGMALVILIAADEAVARVEVCYQ